MNLRLFLRVLFGISLFLGRGMFAQGTAFTYQGRLADNGALASGVYDLLFALYTDPGAGVKVGSSATNLEVIVTDGLFTTMVDVGASPFSGGPRWLEIGVRHAGVGSYTILSPRQAITVAPYAINSATAAAVTGPVPVAQLSGLIDTGNIASRAITAAKIDVGAVTATKIAAGAVSQLGTPNGAVVNALQMVNGGDAALSGDLTVNGGKGIVYYRTGSQKMMFIALAGLGVSNLGVNQSVDGTLDWGDLGFTSAPAVFVGDFDAGASGLQNYAQCLVTAHSVTTTGCKVRVLNAGNASATFSGNFNCMIIGSR